MKKLAAALFALALLGAAGCSDGDSGGGASDSTAATETEATADGNEDSGSSDGTSAEGLEADTLACLETAVGGTVEDQTEVLGAGVPDDIVAIYRAVSGDDSIDATIQVGADNAAATAAYDRESQNLGSLPAEGTITQLDNIVFYVLDFDEATPPTLQDADAAIAACF